MNEKNNLDITPNIVLMIKKTIPAVPIIANIHDGIISSKNALLSFIIPKNAQIEKNIKAKPSIKLLLQADKLFHQFKIFAKSFFIKFSP